MRPSSRPQLRADLDPETAADAPSASRSERRPALVGAIGERPAAAEHRDAAARLAERLEGLAVRHAKVLEVLDLRRARACREAGALAREAEARFHAWMRWDPPLDRRLQDLAIWREAQRRAEALDVAPFGERAA